MRYRSAALLAVAAGALLVTGSAAATILGPTQIDFGPVAVGTTASYTFTLTADSGYAVFVASGAGINAPFGFNIGSGCASTCVATENFSPTATGRSSGDLDVFECPTAGGSCLQDHIYVQGTGANPTLSTPPRLDFGDQTVDQPTAVSWLVVQDSSPVATTFAGASPVISGPNASDFTNPAGDDTCTAATLPAGGACFIGIRFSPGQAGARTATLTLDANNANPAPATVPLFGTGVAANAGPAGPAGPRGTTGATGPRGPAGKVELVSCKRVTVKHRKVNRCTTKVVSGTVKFTTTGTVTHAVLSRRHRTAATGIATGRRGQSLLLSAARMLTAGRYTLTLTRRGHRSSRAVTLIG